MPTGYTYPVSTGELTDFTDYALKCSRAFGVLVRMRDDSMDAPIPDKLEPSSYHKDMVDELTAKRKELLEYSESQIVQAINTEYDAALERRKKEVEETDQMRVRYMNMLAKAESWVPPTADHEPLKTFMVEQLRSSVNQDCAMSFTFPIPAKDKKPEVWRTEKLNELEKELKYNIQKYEQDLENTAACNKWLKDLRDSLAGYTEAAA